MWLGPLVNQYTVKLTQTKLEREKKKRDSLRIISNIYSVVNVLSTARVILK